MAHFDILQPALWALDDPATAGEFGSHFKGWAAFVVDNAVCVQTLIREAPPIDVVFDPGDRFVAVIYSASVRVVKRSSGERVVEVVHGTSVTATAFSPDSRFLATAGADGAVCLTKLESAGTVGRLIHEHPVTSVGFAEDGSLLATACGQTASVWTITGEEIVRVEFDGHVEQVDISPDARYLVARLADGSERAATLDLDDLLAEAERRVSRNLTRPEWAEFVGKEPYRATFAKLSS